MDTPIASPDAASTVGRTRRLHRAGAIGIAALAVAFGGYAVLRRTAEVDAAHRQRCAASRA